jgi:hypothetical protein
MANTLPRPAASWLAAPVKVASAVVVTVLLDLWVDEAFADSVQLHSVVVAVARVVGATELAGGGELAAGAAEEAGAADETGAAEELTPPAGSAAQAALASERVAVNIVSICENGWYSVVTYRQRQRESSFAERSW